jgi:hypothetical protein
VFVFYPSEAGAEAEAPWMGLRRDKKQTRSIRNRSELRRAVVDFKAAVGNRLIKYCCQKLR